MQKNVFVNFLISLIAVLLFFLGNSVWNYVTTSNSIELLPYKMAAGIMIPIVLGVVISYPFSNCQKGNFNWSKFLIQGIPALVLAIPIKYVIFSLMPVLGVKNIVFGIFDHFIDIQSQNMIFHSAFGVWFGKVLSESFFSLKRVKE